jgi:hypothetical protein
MSLLRWFRQLTEPSADRSPWPQPPERDAIDPSSDDVLRETLARYRQQLDEIEKLRSQEHKERLRDADLAALQAMEWLRETGVDRALLEVLHEVKHWPSWLKSESYHGHEYLALEDLTAEKTELAPSEVAVEISFVFNDHRWRFRYARMRSSGPPSDFAYAKAQVWCDEEHVLAVSMTRPIHDDDIWWVWKVNGVDALAPGTWAASILELASEISLHHQQQRHEFEARWKLERAAHLPPPKD